MRSKLLNLVVSSLALAFPLAAGCSQQTDTEGEGGSNTMTGVILDGVGGFSSGGFGGNGSGFPLPFGLWVNRYGDAEDQKAGAFAVNQAGDIALTGSARGTIDLGNVPWTGSTTDSDVFVAKISTQGHSLWSRRYGDSCEQHGSATALAPTGDVLVAGDFCGKMDFGSTTVEAPPGEVDIFVAVIDDLGEDVYSLRIGGAGPQLVRAAAIDAKGNAVLVGSFEEAFDDGAGSVASAGMDDIFVIKLDPTGKVLWSQRFGGLESDIARAVTFDQDGNVIVGGSFEGSADFGGGPIAAATGHSSAFVMALDPQGKPLWSHSFPSDDETVVNAVAVNAYGVVAATGSFRGTADFGSGPELSAGAEDVFFASIDTDGKPLGAVVFGGPKSQIGTGVAFWGNGEVAISTTSQEPLDFGSSSMFPIDQPLTPEMLYLARFTAAGSLIDGRALGSSTPIESLGVGLAGDAGSVLVGSFQGPLDSAFGATESKGGWDVFVSHTN